MNTDLDLNIENYNLEDILTLFKLNYSFGEKELKQAYRQVLMTHPDKSGLSKDYFLFFSKAFKALKYIYGYQRKKNASCVLSSTANKNTIHYTPEITSQDGSQPVNRVNRKLKQTINQNNFNREKFNELFTKVKIYDEEQDGGYDEWLKNNQLQDDTSSSQLTLSQIQDEIERKKKNLRSLVVYQDLQEMGGDTGFSLTRDRPP